MAIDRTKVAKQAEEYLAAGRIGKAIDNFLKLLEDNPKDLNLTNRIGDIYLQDNKQTEALVMFKRAATGFEQNGFLNKAVAIYKKAFRAAPDDMDLAARLVDTYKRANMLKDAAQLHIQLADSYIQKGLIPRALKELSEVVALDPRNIKYKIKLAELYLKEGLKEKAAEIFLDGAEMLAKEGLFAEANQVLERAESMAATAQIYLTHSRISVLQKDFNAAKIHLDHGLKTYPKDTVLIEARAEIEIQQHQPVAALEILAKIPQQSQKYLAVCERALRECQAKGQAQKALDAFSGAVIEIAKMGHGDAIKGMLLNVFGNQPIPEYWLLQAEIAYQDGAKGEQIDSLKYALSLMPTGDKRYEAIRKKLLDLGVAANELKISAPPSLKAAPAPSRNNATALDPQQKLRIAQMATEAKQLESSNRFDKAIELYQSVLEIDPLNSDAIESIAEIHRASGMLTKVQAHYCKVAEKMSSMGDNSLAIAYLDKAEALIPGSTRIYRLTWGLNGPSASKPIPRPEPIPLAVGAATAEPPPLEPAPQASVLDLSIPPEESNDTDSQFSLGDLDLALPEIPPSTGILPEGPDDAIQHALDSIDFQIDFGSPEEAMMEIERGLSIYQGHPELLKRREIVEERMAEKKGVEKTGLLEPNLDSASFDLSDILDLSFGAAQDTEEMNDNTKVAEHLQTAEELFGAFRNEIAGKVSIDDYDTQYNLGIAYKEMMLADPAIEAFKKAMADPERTLECCSMLALCEEMKGDADAAAQWLQKGIKDPGFPPIDSIGLRRDLADLLNRLGRHDEAEAHMQSIQGIELG
jgi:tetratricopeptide (TPR) repeat protein